MKNSNTKINNIYLIGPMGAGKTSIGRHLAELASLSFIDSDQEIEKQTGVATHVIFEIEGEQGFRKREHNMIVRLTGLTGIVLATGGGSILDEDNCNLLSENGTVVYLRATLDTQFNRTGQKKGTRPLLDVDDPMSKLKELNQIRDPLYCKIANQIYDTDQFTHAKAVAQKIYNDWLQL